MADLRPAPHIREVPTVLLYAVLLVFGALISERAARSVLSTASFFLVGGFAAGALGLLHVTPDDPIVRIVSEIALFTVLFTDGMRVELGCLEGGWGPPLRALGIGMPLAAAGMAVLAKWLLGVSWPEAFLVAWVLSPTDPVFASALVGREEVPRPLRELLNIESGLNDGLALPLVLLCLAWMGRVDENVGRTLLELVLGVALGVAVPAVAVLLARTRFFAVSKGYRPLGIIGIGLVVLSASEILHANVYLAAFAAGVFLGRVASTGAHEFAEPGQHLAELAKLAAVMFVGALLTPELLAGLSAKTWLFALLALVAVRPLTLALALAGSGMPQQHVLVAGWFGPKGFASAVYGLLVLHAVPGPEGQRLFATIAVVIGLSILAHSSSDVPVARWFERRAA